MDDMNYGENMTFTIGTALRRTSRAFALAATTTLVGLGAVTPALAQSTQSDAPEATQTEYSDDKLDAFVVALRDVDAVRQTYIPQIQAAEDEAEQRELIEEANVAITDTIDAAPDISVDEYVAIAELAAQDAALNQRIVERVQPAQE